MKFLVDTHILLWSFIEPEKLSDNVRAILLHEDNEIYYSPINLWEISIKYALGKLRINKSSPEELFEEIDNSYFLCKHIANSDIITTYKLPLLHNDPFDRFLIWESLRNDLVFISVDRTIEKYREIGLRLEY